MGDVDFQLLESKFGLVRSAKPDSLLTVSCETLLTQSGAAAFLNEYAVLIKATDTTAAAAYLSANFSMTALALHYAMAVWNRSFPVVLADLQIQLHKDPHGYTRMTFVMESWPFEEGPTCGNQRAAWRDDVFAQYYGGTVRSLYDSISLHSGLHISQLWGQLPTRFNYYLSVMKQDLEKAIENEPEAASRHEEALAHLTEDYRVLSQDWDGQVFGRTRNPLNVEIRYLEDLRNPGKQIRMKNACCLYYKTGGGSYCYTCPRLKPEEREQIRQEYLAASAR